MPVLRAFRLALFASALDEVWVTQFGTPLPDAFKAVVPFGDGFAAAGFTKGAPFPLEEGNAGGADFVVVGLSTDGDVEWSVQAGSSSDDSLYAAAVAGSTLIAVGDTAGALPGESGESDTAGPVSGGADFAVLAVRSVFLVSENRYDGHLLYMRQFGTTGLDRLLSPPGSKSLRHTARNLRVPAHRLRWP